MNSKKVQILFLILILLLSSFACNLSSAVKPEEVKVVPTLAPAEQQQLESQLADQINQAVSGVPITIELSESQLTSMINSQAQTASQEDAQISGLQVTLDNNQATISGDMSSSGISGKISIVLAVATDDQGRPTLSIVSGTMGGFSIPAAMLTSVSTAINQGLQNQAQSGYTIQAMSISDHKLFITAVKQ